MKIQFFIFAAFFELFFYAAGAQTLTNKPIFETQSVKVVANENFPIDMESEIFIGDFASTNVSPYFRTEGKQGHVEKFIMETAGSGPVVSMLQKEGETNSYVLYLFFDDKEGKITALFDLNMNGIWNVKREHKLGEQKNFILFQGQWLMVDKIDGLLSKTPIAKSGDKKYAFQGVWRLAN